MGIWRSKGGPGIVLGIGFLVLAALVFGDGIANGMVHGGLSGAIWAIGVLASTIGACVAIDQRVIYKGRHVRTG